MPFANFLFLRPFWLVTIIPVIIGLIWLARRPVGVRIWKQVIDAHLLPYVLRGADKGLRRWSLLLIGVGGILAAIALAGPAWERLPQPVFRNQDALVIALDLSRSMDSEDVTPSRLQRARFKINDILNERADGQTALIVYAAQAFTVSPLTDDAATIIAQLPVLTTDLMPTQGSRVDRALSLAGDLLRQSGAGRGNVLVVTDGANPESSGPAAQELVAAGYRVSVLGVGTEAGGPIPGQGGLIKGKDGAIVIAQLDRAALGELADAGGGTYHDLAADDDDIKQLLTDLDGAPANAGETELTADVWHDRGYWLLLPLLPLAALIFRRGFLLAFAMVIIIPMPRAEAFNWQDLWQRPDQQASEWLENGDAERAAESFDDPAWQAAARYRAGQFEASLHALEGHQDVEAAYNRGNALARLGRFEDAIQAYDQALDLNPEHDDALFNRKLIEDLMDQQQQQQSQTGENQDQQNQQNQQQDQQQNQQSAGNQKDERNPDSAQDEQRGNLNESDDREESDSRDDDKAGEDIVRSDMTDSEAQQAVDQWLRVIPDDPGGLLRRKFLLQYQQQRRPEHEENQQW